MGAPRPPLDISSKEVIRLFRAWGWSFVSEGVKEVTLKNGTSRLSVRRKQKADADPVYEAARIQGISPEAWLAGPREDDLPPVTDLSEEDIDFFMKFRLSKDSLVGDKERYRHIRNLMNRQGVLKQYVKVRDEMNKPVVVRPAPIPPGLHEASDLLAGKVPAPEPKLIEPLPVEVDEVGYISLTKAMAMRNLKPNKLSFLSCEIIATLAQGDIADGSGKATAKLHELLPSTHGDKPRRPTAVTMLLQDWEKAGLVWRETNGKRTYKIGLSMPVKLTDAERKQYTRDLGYVEFHERHDDGVEPEDVIEVPVTPPVKAPEPVEPDLGGGHEFTEEALQERDEQYERPWSDLDPAVQVLLAERKLLAEQLRSIDYALNILQNRQDK